MLKFSGYPYLIRGQNGGCSFWEPPAGHTSLRFCCARGRAGAANGFEVSPRAGAGQAPNTKQGLKG